MQGVDAVVNAQPRFRWLVLAAVVAALLQATLLHDPVLRGASPSLLTIVLIWSGLRGGALIGGWVGLVGGALEDALGGGGVHALGAVAVSALAGALSRRFFPESIAVFAGAIVAGTLLRDSIDYVLAEVALGQRGLWLHVSHAMAWEALWNTLLAVMLLVGGRVWTAWRTQ